MASSKSKGQVELGRATVRDFMVMLKAPNDSVAFFDFCEKVVIGGIFDLSMDEMPAVIGEVMAEIGRCSAAISKAISLSQMMGDIDKHLEAGDDDG